MKTQTVLLACVVVFLSAALTLPAAPPAAPVPAPRTIDDVRGGTRSFRLNEVEASGFDARTLTPLARAALEMPGMKWRHAQTEHFVVHFEREIFATKVARMAEFLYRHIAEELKADKDLVEGRSHIFIFRDAPDYKRFMGQSKTDIEWAYSFVQGPAMFLQPLEDTKESGGLLAHEMTHMVLNRFFSGRPPIWLNEGLAEWFEEFGYAAYKGTKKSRRAQFQGFSRRVPLDTLLGMTSYPTEMKEIHAFYETSKFLVGYLLLKHDPARIIPFTESVISGSDVYAALSSHYGIASAQEFQKAFDAFVR